MMNLFREDDARLLVEFPEGIESENSEGVIHQFEAEKLGLIDSELWIKNRILELKKELIQLMIK